LQRRVGVGHAVESTPAGGSVATDGDALHIHHALGSGVNGSAVRRRIVAGNDGVLDGDRGGIRKVESTAIVTRVTLHRAAVDRHRGSDGQHCGASAIVGIAIVCEVAVGDARRASLKNEGIGLRAVEISVGNRPSKNFAILRRRCGDSDIVVPEKAGLNVEHYIDTRPDVLIHLSNAGCRATHKFDAIEIQSGHGATILLVSHVDVNPDLILGKGDATHTQSCRRATREDDAKSTIQNRNPRQLDAFGSLGIVDGDKGTGHGILACQGNFGTRTG